MDLIVRENNLPTTMEDLSKFVLVGRDKLQAVRAEISAMQNLKLAKEVREQKLAEGQEIGKLVLLAEARLGTLFNQMPKATANNNVSGKAKENTQIPAVRKLGNAQSIEIDDEPPPVKPKPKLEVAAEMGFNKNQVAQFQKLADNPDAVQKAIDDAEKNDEIVTRTSALQITKNAEKTQRQKETAERKTYTPPAELPTDKFKLFCADIRNGLPDIEDNSVDFIITDPPYPKEFLPLYEDLSKVAARVLKDGGSLICMTGQSYLPEVIQLLSTSLKYNWCLSYVTMGDKTQIWQRRVHTAWKPLLWFVKGEYKSDWLGDDVISSPNKDKTFHDWGQSLGGMRAIIERMTYPDDVILDPFLGGGTTGVVAVTSGRKFIGVDVEQSCVDTSRARIEEVFTSGNRQDNARAYRLA